MLAYRELYTKVTHGSGNTNRPFRFSIYRRGQRRILMREGPPLDAGRLAQTTGNAWPFIGAAADIYRDLAVMPGIDW